MMGRLGRETSRDDVEVSKGLTHHSHVGTHASLEAVALRTFGTRFPGRVVLEYGIVG